MPVVPTLCTSSCVGAVNDSFVYFYLSERAMNLSSKSAGHGEVEKVSLIVLRMNSRNFLPFLAYKYKQSTEEIINTNLVSTSSASTNQLSMTSRAICMKELLHYITHVLPQGLGTPQLWIRGFSELDLWIAVTTFLAFLRSVDHNYIRKPQDEKNLRLSSLFGLWVGATEAYNEELAIRWKALHQINKVPNTADPFPNNITNLRGLPAISAPKAKEQRLTIHLCWNKIEGLLQPEVLVTNSKALPAALHLEVANCRYYNEETEPCPRVPMGYKPGSFNTAIDITHLIKGCPCDRQRARNLGSMENLGRLRSGHIRNSWTAFMEWLDRNSYLKSILCFDCPEHLRIWIAMAKCLCGIGNPSSAFVLVALQTRLQQVLDIKARLGTP